ncbi:hypothetical protein [Burkholderia pseudomallei]|uniref:hypothetical protein n=1 Tax=Burkholderia pseudomallei TaxID=28450 RepID=UPI00030F0D32|nr:hypothetical protein [Burkholderia pseudomallei]
MRQIIFAENSGATRCHSIGGMYFGHAGRWAARACARTRIRARRQQLKAGSRADAARRAVDNGPRMRERLDAPRASSAARARTAAPVAGVGRDGGT